ncbi:MAG: hypothetical protein PUB87_04445 [Eubacteriaceae bacterium]|nr:hypothetical protein [Eubacteriaceae bacterium]
MRKFTAILMTVLMIAGLFVSCDNNAPVVDETVSVSFDEAVSRSLTASLEQFDKTQYYWKYAAQKADTSGLTSGETGTYDETGAAWIKDVDSNGNRIKGLGSVAGFSQGIWDFKLFAYKSVGTDYMLAYQGEVTGVSLKKGSNNSVVVSVNPIEGQEAGTLKIDDNITFVPKKDGNPTTGFTKVYTVTALGSTDSINPVDGKTNEWSLSAGAYKVKVDFVKDGYVYASGSVVATVYSNLTTTVSGELNELVTEAVFDSSINPDVMNKEASGSANLSALKEEDASDVILKDAETEEASKVVAKVPAAAASKIIKNVAGNEAPNNTTVALALRVDTVSATNTTLELEIGMQATVTQKDSENNVIKQTTHKVTELKNSENNPVISEVTIKLQPGLRNVVVKHNGTPMTDLSTTTDDQGYTYDANSGILTIKTSSFSPFVISYDEPVYVATIGNVNYTTLQAAVDAASSDATIVLTNDVVVKNTVTIDKNLTIELSGYTIFGNGVRALQIKENTTKINGPGTITSNVGNVGSSVIRVGDNSATATVKLYINEGVTVTTDTAYGITVFGSKNEYLYVYGSVISNAPENPAYDGCAVATLGTDTSKSYIYIYDGAVVSAANTNAIYMPSGELTVNAGSTITGRTGIYVKSGKTTIKGGTITGNGLYQAYNYYGNGGISTGDAFVVDSCGYPNGKPSVSITGGTFISENAQPVASYNTEGNDSVNGFIKGGAFSKKPNHTFLYKYCLYCDELTGYWIVSSEKAHRIDFDQNDNICEDCGTIYPILKKTENTDGTYKTSGLKSFSTITNGSYKLFEDISNTRICIGSALDRNMTVDIDLGGHTLTSIGTSSWSGFYFHPNTLNNTITFKNGTILESAGNGSSSLISIKGTSNNKMIFESDLNIVCVNPTTTAILVESDGKLESSANITTTKDAAIQTNGSSTKAGAAITINGGNITSDTVAIYLPNGTLEISGGTITGTTAVYTKGYKVTISGGTLVGNGSFAEYVYNGNGCNSTGDAFVVDSCNYPSGVPVVEISGGNFISEKNKAVGSYFGNGVTGPVIGFIKGGTFSSDPSAYVDTANYNVTDNGSTWTVTAK